LPIGRIVKADERTRVPNIYQIGKVCQIIAKENPKFRGKMGVGIASSRTMRFVNYFYSTSAVAEVLR